MNAVADYADGQTAALQRVSLRFSAEGLEILSATGDRIDVWPTEDLVLDELQQGTSLIHCESRPLASLTVADAATVAQLKPFLRAHRHLGGRHRMALGLGLLAALLVLVGLVYVSVRPLARIAARHVPFSVERQLGGVVLDVLPYAFCEEPETLVVLRDLSRSVLIESEPPPEIHVVDWDVPNAFALPGGLVIFTTGFLREAQSVDEVAGVMAHELEHLQRRHVMQTFIERSILVGGWTILFGDYSGLMLVDPGTALELVQMRHGRSHESEADEGALVRLEQAQLSSQGIAQFLERMQKQHGDGGPEWLSSHPATAQRIELLRRAPAGQLPIRSDADAARGLAALHRSCSAKQGGARK